ncbi:MAG: prohibitin family protein [Clostridia bacterium]|nr:prohibitin family protein [Clostridia bacterium]
MITILLTGVLIAVVAVGAILSMVFSGAMKTARTKVRANKVAAGVFLGVAIAGGASLALIPGSIHTVEAGQVAVVKDMGEAKEVRDAGTYFDFWITRTYIYYDATVQNLDIKAGAYSKDAQTMDIEMTVQYQINGEDAVSIANKYGNLQTLENRIRSVATEKAKARLSSYSAMEIIETRSEISPQVESDIIAAIGENYHVSINTVVLTNIDFSDAFEKIVEDKMIAEQEKLKAEYEKETAIINAEKELEVAKKNAEATVAKAEADAEAQKLVAAAQAQAIAYKSVEVARMLGFNIKETTVATEVEKADGTTATEYTTEYTIDFEGKTAEEIQLISDYLKYVEYLDAWNGELPDTVVTDSSGASIILPTP